MFGWRRRIGFISPTVMEVKPYDFYLCAPPGVGQVGVTCGIEGWRQEEYDRGLEQVDAAARYLGSRHVDFVVHGGVPLVISRGADFMQSLVQRLETLAGVGASTSVHSALESLRHLGAGSIVLATPYTPELNETTAAFLRGQGLQVAHAACLNAGFKELQAITHAEIYRFVTDAARAAPRAEAIYLPCPQWPAFEIVATLEADTGRPVVCSDGAEFWYAFSRLCLRGTRRGFGILLDSLADAVPTQAGAVPGATTRA